MTAPPAVSVVCPVYNEADGILDFLSQLRASLEALGVDHEVLVVDDGSTDATLARLLSMDWPAAEVLALGRNRGHQAALMAGLREASGDVIITMDADGQHPPELIPDMVCARHDCGVDVVYMVRTSDTRVSWPKRHTSRFFYLLARGRGNSGIKTGQADFRLMTRRVRDELAREPGTPVLRIAVPALNFPSTSLTYEQRDRLAGTTKYTWRKMLQLGWNYVFNASSLPLRVSSMLAFFLSILTVLWTLLVIVTFVSSRTVSGWASVMTAVLVLGTAVTVLLAIQGQYIARLYDLARGREIVVPRERIKLQGSQHLQGPRHD